MSKGASIQHKQRQHLKRISRRRIQIRSHSTPSAGVQHNKEKSFFAKMFDSIFTGGE